MGAILKPNKLGWITSMTLNASNDLLDASSYSGTNYVIGRTTYNVDLSIVVEDSGAVHKLLADWMHNGVHTATFQKEYMCLYCASPNSIEHTHCQKCGAPRSFVLG